MECDSVNNTQPSKQAWPPASQPASGSFPEPLLEILTWERGHSLANVLWFISLSSSFKALRTVAWFHCSAGKSSNFEQLENSRSEQHADPNSGPDRRGLWVQHAPWSPVGPRNTAKDRS